MSTTTAAGSELRRHWPAVLACFATAIFAWGFGFYGQSVYVAELQHTRGWSSGAVSGATSLFYLTGAAALVRLHAVMARLGPRRVLTAGAVLLGLGATGFANSVALWQLYVSALVMGCGWAGSSGAAISTTLAHFFDRQRGLAISLAFNGASAAGFTVAPLLVALAARAGLATAVPITAGVFLAILLPLLAVGVRVERAARVVPTAQRESSVDARPSPTSAQEALATPCFWTISMPFGLAIMAQVGVIVHLVAYLRPLIGADGSARALALVAFAAMAGRLAVGTVIDRIDQRRASAASFASQVAGLALMVALPVPWALYAGCVLFGLSVGNVITFPALIVQREFAPAAFALVIGLNTAIVQLTFACGPALLGAIRDFAGSYTPSIAFCMAAELVAAAIVLAGRPRALSRSTVLG